MKDTTKQREAVTKALAEGQNVVTLAHRVLELQTRDKLLLAADLLLLNQVSLAQTIAQRAIDEIALVILFAKKEQASRR